MVKKGQFKIQQMSFMLLGVVLFFLLVGLFWIILQSSGLREQATELGRQEAIMMAEFLSGSSEFGCSGDFGSYCVDGFYVEQLLGNSKCCFDNLCVHGRTSIRLIVVKSTTVLEPFSRNMFELRIVGTNVGLRSC